MADWGLTIEDAKRTVYSYLQSAQSLTLTLPLNGTGTLDMTMNGAASDLRAITTLLATTTPVVRLVRDQVTVFKGPLAAMDMTVGDATSVTLSFTDWTGPMDRWSSFGQWNRTAGGGGTGTPVAIIDTLIGTNEPHVAAKYPYGVVQLVRYTPSGETLTSSRTSSVNSGEQSTVLEQLQQASTAAHWDWYVRPQTNPVNLDRFTVADTLGNDLHHAVRFGLGQTQTSDSISNLMSARMTLRPPVNKVYATSSKNRPRSSPKAWTYAKVNAGTGEWASLHTYGEYFTQVDAGNGNARLVADNLRRDKPRQIVDVSADPALAPVWGVDYYLGDIVDVTINTPALTVNDSLRVNQIVVVLDDTFTETSNDLTFEVV